MVQATQTRASGEGDRDKRVFNSEDGAGEEQTQEQGQGKAKRGTEVGQQTVEQPGARFSQSRWETTYRARA